MTQEYYEEVGFRTPKEILEKLIDAGISANNSVEDIKEVLTAEEWHRFFLPEIFFI